MPVVELPGEDLSAIVLRSLGDLGITLPGQTVPIEEALASVQRTLEEECSDRTPKEALERAEKVGVIRKVGKSKEEITPQCFPPLALPSSAAFYRHHSLFPDKDNEGEYGQAEAFVLRLLPVLTEAALEGKTLLDSVAAKKLGLEENWMRKKPSQQALWLLKQALAIPVLKDGSRVRGVIPPLLSLLHDKDFLYPEGGFSQLCTQEGWADLPQEERRKQLKVYWNEVHEFPYWKSLPAAFGVN